MSSPISPIVSSHIFTFALLCRPVIAPFLHFALYLTYHIPTISYYLPTISSSLSPLSPHHSPHYLLITLITPFLNTPIPTTSHSLLAHPLSTLSPFHISIHTYYILLYPLLSSSPHRSLSLLSSLSTTIRYIISRCFVICIYIDCVSVSE